MQNQVCLRFAEVQPRLLKEIRSSKFEGNITFQYGSLKTPTKNKRLKGFYKKQFGRVVVGLNNDPRMN